MRGAGIPLSGLALPAALGLLRDHVRPEGRRSPHYLERYDRLTLVYDAFREGRDVTLVCPRLLNLWPVLREGLRCGGRPVRVRRQVLPRIEILRFAGEGEGEGEVEVRHGDWREALPVGPAEAARFAGRACAVAVSRDNEPGWIEDWARWHRSAHGLEAAVIFDNGSTAYGPEAVEAALGRAGLADWAVIRAPQPYGPTDGSTKWEVSPRFFQTAMLNVARLRLFPHARAVLSCDIDELVVSRSGGSVFDAAARSPLGVASFFGRWAYPEVPGGARPQREHRMVVPEERRLNTKWCAAPRALGRRPWAVHRFGGPAFLLTWRPDLGFRHCRATTTSWKKAPLDALPDGAVRDEAFAALLAGHLGPEGQGPEGQGPGGAEAGGAEAGGAEKGGAEAGGAQEGGAEAGGAEAGGTAAAPPGCPPGPRSGAPAAEARMTPPGSAARPDLRTGLLILVVLIVANWALRSLMVVLMPLVAAILIALAVMPVRDRVAALMPRRLRWLGVAAAMGVVLLVLLAFFGGLFLAGRQLAGKVPEAAEQIGAALAQAGAAGVGEEAGGTVRQGAAAGGGTAGAADGSGPLHALTDPREALRQGVDQVVGAAGGAARVVLNSALAILGGLVLIFFLTLLILVESGAWARKVERVLGRRAEGSLAESAEVVAQKFRAYVTLQAALGATTGTLYAAWLGFWGVDLILVWSLLSFLMNFIPNLGSLVAGGTTTAYAIATQDLGTAAAVGAGVLTIEQAMGNVVAPLLQGRNIALSPLVVLVSLVFWGWAWGVAGALLAVPVTFALVVLMAHVPALRPWALLLTDQTDLEGLDEATRP